MQSRENIALFDRYLNGEMDEAEKNAFEERLNHSESLKTAFEDYKDFAKKIVEGAEYSQIIEQLDTIHADLYPQKKSRVIKPQFWIFAGVAASIALLIFFNPFGLNLSTGGDSAYEPLANNDVYSEEALEMEDQINEEYVTDLDSVEMNYEIIPLGDNLEEIDITPFGTAFLIAENGFFLTSKHLVENYSGFVLQQKELGFTFEVSVVYRDTLLDFAVLKCSEKMADRLEAVPFELVTESPELGDEVFTLGYPKKDIVYTEGVVSSETGYNSDSIYFEVSLPSNAGHSGAPLFNEDGNLIGIITAQHSDKQAVTYVLKHDYINDRLGVLADSLGMDLSSNYSKKMGNTNRLIKLYRPFIFELH